MDERTVCTVLVTSCDAYEDVEGPFIALWRTFWPDCPFETVLLTESPRTCGGTGPQFDRILAVGRGKTWCAMLAEALETIRTPYVLLLMNDYFLQAPVETARFMRRLEQARTFNAANLRLNPNPPGRWPWLSTDLLEHPKNAAYCVTCQAGIWERSFLLGLARRNKSAWEFERRGSFMLEGETRPLLVTLEKEFPFVDAVHKGYWEKEGLAVVRRNGVPVDLARRGRPPFSVCIREGIKKALFALFPWTLIVRIQNALDLGMKEKKRAPVTR